MNGSNTLLTERLERLKFIVEEMQIANHIASNTSDQFFARTIARHILIRAENFIEHARQLRKPLNIAGYNTAALHGAKEAFVSDFEENYLELRHKLGAHVQDMDFGRHVEIWQELESVKVNYFLEEALRIYNDLAQLNIPGYVPYAPSIALLNDEIRKALEAIRRASATTGHVEFAADTLAMTRPNSSILINTTPIHQRAGQLALLKRLVDAQSELLSKISDDITIARILRARIITDIVSFFDCLMTRPVSEDSPQSMEGLDSLVRTEQESFQPVEEFIAVTRFDDFLLAARELRNSIGAHLSDDFSRPLKTITDAIDQFDIHFLLNFFYRLHIAFKKVCSGILYLRMYAIDGERMYGVLPGREEVVPYNEEQGDATSFPALAPPVYDQEGYFKQLQLWLHGDSTAKASARDYFYKAFLHSPTIEIVEDPISSGSSYRNERHELREAHKFITSTLMEGVSEQEFTDILILLNSCSNGHPYSLAESIIRYGKYAPTSRQRQICCLLGEIASYPHTTAEEYLESNAMATDWSIKLSARTALYKTFIWSEGAYRSNHKHQISRNYSSVVDPLFEHLSIEEIFICKISFVSQLFSGKIGTFIRHFEENYKALQKEIREHCISLLEGKADQPKIDLLDQLINSHDYIGVCCWVSQIIEGGAENPFAIGLLSSCCIGLIEPARHGQSTRHFAMCFHLLRSHAEAAQIMADLADSHPQNTMYQVLAIELLEHCTPPKADILRKIDFIRKTYLLEQESELTLQAIEQRISN